MTIDEWGVPGAGGESTLQFLVAWAEERIGNGGPRRRERGATALTPCQLAAVVRRTALLLGDRPLRQVTLGDLAQLPAMLREAGMAPVEARSACREIRGALRAALGGGSPTRRS